MLLLPGRQTLLATGRLARLLQHRHGNGALLPVQIIAEGLTRQCLPVALHRQRVDLLQIPGQIQRAANRKEHFGDLFHILPGDICRLDDRQQGVQMTGAGHQTRQLLRHTRLHIALIARQPLFAGRPFEQFIQLAGQGCHPRRKVRDITRRVQLVAAVAQEPASSTTSQTHQLVHERQLQLGRYLVIQCLDLLPPVRQTEHVADDHIGRCDIGRTHAGGLLEPLHEGDAHVVDQIVGDLSADDLALEAVLTHLRAKLGHQLGRESRFHIADQIIIIRHTRFQQGFLEIDLAVGNQHRQLRTRQALAVGQALADFLLGRQKLQRPVELAGRLQCRHQPAVLANAFTGAALSERQCLSLFVVVAQHQRGHFVGHLGQELVALLLGHVAGLDHATEENLDVHLVVGAVHPTGVVDEVGVARAAIETELDPAQLGHAQVAALTEDLGAQFTAVDPQAVVGLVADIGVGLPARFHIGADATVPDQVHGRLEQRVDQIGWCQLVGLDTEARLHLRRDGDALGAALEDAATFGDQRGVIVGPGGARQGEHALTLGKALRRIRVGVDEDVHVVEGSDHLQLVRQQQAVAEHVTGHVADADHRGQILLDVDALFAEMPLHGDPAAFGGNTHALVVVAGRTAGGERVAQPEAVVQGNTVGDIGEGRRTLVSRHHQIRVVGVVAYHVARRHDLTILEVVGDIQQATDENAVAGDALCQYLITVAAHRHLARDEAALGAHRHNHRILHLLRLDQTQHLGAVVFLAVGPAQTTTGHVAKAQVYALDARAVDEDFELGHRSRNVGNRAGVELEAEVRLGLAAGIGLIEVGAQGGLDQIQIAPEDAVLVEHRDIVQRGENGLLQLLLLDFQVIAGELAGQVETGLEQAHQLADDVGMVDQRAGNVAVIEAQTDLLEVTGIGPQHRHITPRQTGGQHQTVEGIVLGIAVDDVHEGILQGLVEHLNIRHLGAGIGEGEIVNPELAAILAAQAVGELAQHPQAEVFQNRQHIRQRQRCIGMVELAVQLRLALGQRLVEAHHQRPLLGQAEQMLHVDHRRVRCKALGVAGREAFGEIGQHLGAVPLAQALQHQAGVVVLP